MNERMPAGWKNITLGSLGHFFGGLSGKKSKDFGQGEPFLTYMQVFSQKTSDKESGGLVKIGGDEKQHKIQFGDILFTTSSETPDEVGMTSVFLEKNWSPYLNSFCFGLRPNIPSPLDPTFAKFLFRGMKFRKDIRPLAQGSTRFNLSQKSLKPLSVLVPPLPEQKKIASILSSVDEVIEGTQKQIYKLQDLKKATMNGLLNKGIGHMDFKGDKRVPKGWRIVSLGKLGAIVGGGTPSSKESSYWNGSILWATPTEITNLQGRYISKTSRKITKAGLKNSSAKLHPAGTILITSRASIGHPAINVVPMSTNQGFQSLIPNENLDTEYGYQLLLHNKASLERLSSGSTFLEISSKEVKKIEVVLPPLPEQKKIASILTAIEEMIEDTQEKINKLQSLKKSLMQDLLTGKIRVQVD